MNYPKPVTFFFSETFLIQVEGEAALAARAAVLVHGHEDAGEALGQRALHARAGDFCVLLLPFNVVVIEDSHLDGLVLVPALLGACEVLLLLLALAT